MTLQSQNSLQRLPHADSKGIGCGRHTHKAIRDPIGRTQLQPFCCSTSVQRYLCCGNSRQTPAPSLAALQLQWHPTTEFVIATPTGTRSQTTYRRQTYKRLGRKTEVQPFPTHLSSHPTRLFQIVLYTPPPQNTPTLHITRCSTSLLSSLSSSVLSP